jgi:hypothetical protein
MTDLSKYTPELEAEARRRLNETGPRDWFWSDRITAEENLTLRTVCDLLLEAGWTPPVDPHLVLARELYAAMNVGFTAEILAGAYDDTPPVQRLHAYLIQHDIRKGKP